MHRTFDTNNAKNNLVTILITILNICYYKIDCVLLFELFKLSVKINLIDSRAQRIISDYMKNNSQSYLLSFI